MPFGSVLALRSTASTRCRSDVGLQLVLMIEAQSRYLFRWCEDRALKPEGARRRHLLSTRRLISDDDAENHDRDDVPREAYRHELLRVSLPRASVAGNSFCTGVNSRTTASCAVNYDAPSEGRLARLQANIIG